MFRMYGNAGFLSNYSRKRITDEFTCEWAPEREPLPKSSLV